MTLRSGARLTRLPLRIRLVLGFAAAMLVVLVAAGAFVFWRVEYALDASLANELSTESADLQRAATLNSDPTAALSSLGAQGRDAQLIDSSGRVLVAGTGLENHGPLLSPAQLAMTATAPVRVEQGYLFSRRGRHVRISALPVRGGAGGPVTVAVAAVPPDQRDEALRELLGQLTLANLGALAIASLVGYRLARAALVPVERYRTRAEQIAEGATGVRLDVPPGVNDEVSRLGHTLNTMLAGQEYAAEQQQRFIDDASHELRTPMTVLAAEIDLALRRPRSAQEYEETLRRIAEDASRLVELADELLTLGAQGTRTLQSRDLPVTDLLDSASKRARGMLPDADGREVRVLDSGGLLAHGDPALLERAMGNLVDNAIRYGDGTITLSARALGERSRAAVLLTVHDEGRGVPTEFLAHAAERFRQAQESRTGRGNGLGLSLVDAIATAHHGQLRFCSNGAHHRQPTANPAIDSQPCGHPSKGTTSSLLLPGPLHT